MAASEGGVETLFETAFRLEDTFCSTVLYLIFHRRTASIRGTEFREQYRKMAGTPCLPYFMYIHTCMIRITTLRDTSISKLSGM